MGDVLFATGKSDVAPGAQRSIDKLVDFLQKNPTRNVLIEGHTDNTGSADLNLRLSQERADAVKELLVAKGISPDRISARGHGLKYPLVSNDTAAGRQQNRRVEVVVLNEGVSPQSVTR
jgi:outer membrane protein OmpA-like peptidoglycan-associated protein